MDFSRLRAMEAVGAIAGLALIISLFLEWFTLSGGPERAQQNAWICGEGNLSCSAWDTFPLMRILLVLAALAPIILAYLVVTDAKLSWPAGEVTTIVGLTAVTLIGYNGIVDKPGAAIQEFGITLSYGYFVALLAAIALAAAGAGRTLESGGGAQRKPPATF
ncbi:MAG: hypothetical protein ACXWW8_07950 [Solirubrobacterales bacterium]|jgi:hypothetical protein